MLPPRRTEPSPGRVRSSAGRSVVALTVVALTAAAFLVGRGDPVPAPDPIQNRDGVPIGDDHSPSGAVVAADEYLATEQATVEEDPARFAALVAEDYASGLRDTALAGARADRRADPAGIRLLAAGGRSLTVIGAHRLDRYEGDSARVTLWVGRLFWGPGQAPCQGWELDRVTLVWQRSQWAVSAMSALWTPAPAPANVPQASPLDDSRAAFDSELGGFAPVSYGSPG